MSITVKPLSDDLPFGARITGVTMANVGDADVQREINEVFTDRGMIIFEEMEPTNAMQIALSEVFGELEDHAIGEDMPLADDDVRGMTDFEYLDIFTINGEEISGWVPWHIDACYAKELNRGGILRALVISPEGGRTGFADGIQLSRAIDPALRDRFENLNVIYHSHLMFTALKFGRPADFKAIKLRQMMVDMIEHARAAPRTVHPAIWTRETGEKVLHAAPWQAAGIEGMEGPEGDALLEQLFAEIEAKMLPYWHSWKPTDMAIWDNWRFLHAASGNPAKYPRRMQRTTIKGDYGLGRYEDESNTQVPVGIDV
ncbi:MAG: TauD/TfdA family dioxygenase [Sphingomonadaceae bacterium]